MAAVARGVFNGAGAGQRWSVASAGTHALGGTLCEVVEQLVLEPLGPATAREFCDAFVPREINDSVIDNADLILTATRAERGFIAQLDPQLRSRTFTLREAVALGRHALDADAAAASAPGDGLAGYAAILHGRRGMVLPPKPRRGRLGLGRQGADPYDLSDVHHSAPRIHRAGLHQVREATVAFSNQVVEYVKFGV